jgi:PAS domain S-box-containing protein
MDKTVSVTGPRILIVDDDAVLLEGLSGMLRIRIPDAQIHTALSAAAGLELLEALEYEAIISDIKMPLMDGLKFMERVKALRPGTPILLITGHGDDALAVQSVTGGAYAFIPKPIDRDYFLAWLERALNEQRLTEEVRFKNKALELYAQDLERMTEERAAEMRLSEERFRSIVDLAPISVSIKDVNGRYLYVNQQAADFVQRIAKENAVGKTDMDLLPPSAAECIRANDRKALTMGRVVEVERIPDGERVRTYVSVKFPLVNADGTPYAVCGISSEISLQKAKEIDGAGRSSALEPVHGEAGRLTSDHS